MSKAEFLSRVGWLDAARNPLAGDASSRQYTRLKKKDATAILMDAGAGSAFALERFSDIAKHLGSLGLSAPSIFSDGSDRFLLIEDLGDAVFSKVIANNPSMELELYKAAIDALIVTHRSAIPDYIAPYGPAEMAEADMLSFEWYPTPNQTHQGAQLKEIQTQIASLLSQYLTRDPVLIQRDFHAENLIWLPQRTGAARVGLLDFQDAVSGCYAYDIASLLIDARRVVSKDTKGEVITYFASQLGISLAQLNRDIALCSAQRNLRILGIFSRLAIRDGKRSYVDLIPRVWSNLMDDLAHPVLGELRDPLTKLLPAPTPALLDEIRGAHV